MMMRHPDCRRCWSNSLREGRHPERSEGAPE